MTNEISLEDIFRIVTDEVNGEAGQGPEPVYAPPALLPVGETAIQEADLSRLVAEAEKNVKARNGLWGQAMARLRGNDLERLKYEQTLSTVKAAGIGEQGEIAVMLAISLQVLGFKVVVSGMEEMDRFAQRFDPKRPAGRLAQTLMADNEATMRQVYTTITTTGRNRILKATNMG